MSDNKWLSSNAPIVGGIAVVASIVVIVVTREHPDPTLIGTLGALATVLFGIKVTDFVGKK